eukprot:scaffold290452_cov37-Prasinocladus_malaysianus.AAC.1
MVLTLVGPVAVVAGSPWSFEMSRGRRAWTEVTSPNASRLPVPVATEGGRMGGRATYFGTQSEYHQRAF